jgi:hypothetical protein
MVKRIQKSKTRLIVDLLIRPRAAAAHIITAGELLLEDNN